jgi:polysaccharide chain length determinant protein (PEP-CTERM system associated)
VEDAVGNEQKGAIFGIAGEGLQIWEYLEAAKRRKWAIALPAIGVFLATVVLAFRLPNIYRAETVIMVDPQQVPNNYVTPTVSSSISDRLSTIQQQVLSPTRLQKLIDTTNLYADLKGRRSQADLVRMVQSSTSVDLVSTGGSRMSAFRIAFSGKRPAEVAKVANQLASMFIEENLKAREAQSEGTAEFLEHELGVTKNELENKEKEVQALKTRNIMDLPDSKQYHVEVLGNLRAQLQASQDRISRAQQEKVYVQSLMMTSHPTVDLDSGAPGSSASPRQGEAQKLESRLAELQARYGPNHPDVRRVRKDLEEVKKKDAADNAKTSAQPQISTEALAADAMHNPVLDSQLNKVNQDIQEQTRHQAQLQEQINFHVSKLERIPIFEQQIAGMMRDYETLRSHYTSLLDKKLSAQMASALESHQKAERFVVLDAAAIPDRPFAPNRGLICMAGLFGGLLGGIGLAALMEMSDESVRSEMEATRIAGKPVLAGIPQLLTEKEQRRSQLQTIGAVVGTVICSVAVGFVMAKFSSLFF